MSLKYSETRKHIFLHMKVPFIIAEKTLHCIKIPSFLSNNKLIIANNWITQYKLLIRCWILILRSS